LDKSVLKKKVRFALNEEVVPPTEENEFDGYEADSTTASTDATKIMTN